jgi:hypothetical protein
MAIESEVKDHPDAVVTGLSDAIEGLQRLLRDYLKTGIRGASPAEQEVPDGEVEEGARAVAADLAGVG